jgi:hypothetical protein
MLSALDLVPSGSIGFYKSYVSASQVVNLRDGPYHRINGSILPWHNKRYYYRDEEKDGNLKP